MSGDLEQERGGFPPARWVRWLLRSCGLGFLFAANVFGAGSIYILSNTGAKFGYSLFWTIPLTLLLGLGMQVIHWL